MQVCEYKGQCISKLCLGSWGLQGSRSTRSALEPPGAWPSLLMCNITQSTQSLIHSVSEYAARLWSWSELHRAQCARSYSDIHPPFHFPAIVVFSHWFTFAVFEFYFLLFLSFPAPLLQSVWLLPLYFTDWIALPGVQLDSIILIFNIIISSIISINVNFYLIGLLIIRGTF